MLVITTLGPISLLASAWNIEILNEMLIVYKKGKERGLADLLQEKIMLSASTHRIFFKEHRSLLWLLQNLC